MLKIEVGNFDFPRDGNVVFGLCTVCFNSTDPPSTATIIDCCNITVTDNASPSGNVALLNFKKCPPGSSFVLVVCFVSAHEHSDDNWKHIVLNQHLKYILNRKGKTPGKKDFLVHCIHFLPKQIKSSSKMQAPDPYDSQPRDSYPWDSNEMVSSSVGFFGEDHNLVSLDRPKPVIELPQLRGHSAEKAPRPHHCLSLRLKWGCASRGTACTSKQHGNSKEGLAITFHYLLNESVSEGGDNPSTGSPLCGAPTTAAEYHLKAHVLWTTRELSCPWCSVGGGPSRDTSPVRGKILEALVTTSSPTTVEGPGEAVDGGSKKRCRQDSASSTQSVVEDKIKGSRHALSLKRCQDLWSGRSCKYVEELLRHLRGFHSHFSYDLMVDSDANLHVLMSRLDEEDTSSPGRVGGFVFYGGSWRDTMTAESLPSIAMSGLLATKTKFDEYMQRKLKKQHLSQPSSPSSLADLSTTERAVATAVLERAVVSQQVTRGFGSSARRTSDHARQYFHCNGSAVDAWELSYESDDDASARWMHQMANNLLDEYEDISIREKAFMKLWNAFVNSFPLHADTYVRHGALLFARRMAPHIIEKGLRHIFLVHLISLWDFSLLTSEDLITCMTTVDAYKVSLSS